MDYVLRVLVLLGLMVAAVGVFWLIDRRKRPTEHNPSALEELEEIFREAELGQYVDLRGVDNGRMRTINCNRFVTPPPGESVVMVGEWAECQHTIHALHLNPARVTIAEYPWRLFNLPPGLRIIILQSAIQLPQINGVLTNLRSLGDAHYVRVMI